jgi:hypothetical protein
MEGSSFNKRQKERNRQSKQKDKQAKKAERQRDKPLRVSVNGEDPDLIGIVAGPQPVEDA